MLTFCRCGPGAVETPGALGAIEASRGGTVGGGLRKMLDAHTDHEKGAYFRWGRC